MDLNKSREFFDPEKIKNKRIHIIGCGAVGSSIAELLARAGVERFVLYDFDVVEPHNIANQMFTQQHIGKEKTTALSEMLYDINPDIKRHIEIKKKWEKSSMLSDYVFLCVDNIDTRREIVQTNLYNPNIIAMFDTRMSLTSGSIYGANWKDNKQKNNFLSTMDYTHEEAKASTPVSACGFELSVASTVRILTAFQVANFMNLINEKPMMKFGIIDAFEFFTEFYRA